MVCDLDCVFLQPLYVVMGRLLCFIHVIICFFFALQFLRPKNAAPRDLCQNVGLCCNFIMQIRERPYLYPLHFEGRKSANFAPQFGDSVTLSSRNWKTSLQIEKKKCVRLCLFLTITPRFHTYRPCSC